MKNVLAKEFFELTDDDLKEESKGSVVSYSQYSMWLNCPWQWKLNYVDGQYRFDQSIDTIFGTAMHNTIQDWLATHFADPKKAKRTDLNPLLKENLITEFKSSVREDNGEKLYVCDASTLQEYYEDGCAILDHVQKYGKDFFPTKNFKLMGCETKLTVQLRENLKFRAYLDIVIHDESLNEYHIIDLKTSRAGWYESQKKDDRKLHQLLLYKRFFAKEYGVLEENVKVKFIILKRKIKDNPDFVIRRLTNFEPAQGSISMKRMEASWNKFLTECFDETGTHRTEDIKPTPSESACKYCPFNNEESLCSSSYYLQRKKKQAQNKKLLLENNTL